MNKTNKSLLILALTITVLLVMSGFVAISLTSHDHILICESLDSSGHNAHSYTTYFEDDVPYIEALTKTYKSYFFNDFHLLYNLSFTSSFISEIWRPPENS
jgi:hypothetical protein